MKHFTLLFFLLFLVLNINAQEQLFKGSTWSFGRSIIHEQMPEDYYYQPISILGNFPVHEFGKLGIYGEYQYAQATNINNQFDFEFGLNMGLRYPISLNATTHLLAIVGAGPHYVTIQTRHQASGFIFSDNFELNLRHYAKDLGTTLQLSARFRHISNAGFKSPNRGIDNFFLLFGVEHRL